MRKKIFWISFCLLSPPSQRDSLLQHARCNDNAFFICRLASGVEEMNSVVSSHFAYSHLGKCVFGYTRHEEIWIFNARIRSKLTRTTAKKDARVDSILFSWLISARFHSIFFGLSVELIEIGIRHGSRLADWLCCLIRQFKWFSTRLTRFSISKQRGVRQAGIERWCWGMQSKKKKGRHRQPESSESTKNIEWNVHEYSTIFTAFIFNSNFWPLGARRRTREFVRWFN